MGTRRDDAMVSTRYTDPDFREIAADWQLGGVTEAMRSTRGRLLRRGRARDNEWAQLALKPPRW